MHRTGELHRWHTRSSHVTSEGRVRYQHCECGRWRVVADTLTPAESVIAGR